MLLELVSFGDETVASGPREDVLHLIDNTRPAILSLHNLRDPALR